MDAYLVCHKCGDKELIVPSTEFVHCQQCNAPRYSEDADGKPLVSWSTPVDLETWATVAQEIKS